MVHFNDERSLMTDTKEKEISKCLKMVKKIVVLVESAVVSASMPYYTSSF